jgi:CRP-like cAMP-binding protein/predicted GNAT family N-acyltransferase
MAIRIKVATTAQELLDVYKLRHQVYVEEEGKFSNVDNNVIVDEFDAVPQSLNVIAYSGSTPVGTIRLNCDSKIKLPSDCHYDFSEYRQRIIDQAIAKNQAKPLIIGVGMLAIDKQWRRRRDVFHALFKMGCDIGQSWGVSHIIVTVNASTTGIYRRLGFETLAQPISIPHIGDEVVPMASPFKPVYDWAFGSFADNSELINSFTGNFECLNVSVGEVIFKQGDLGNEAYLIGKGQIRATQVDTKSGREFQLAILAKGALFGELSLIDNHARSATITATANTELIVLTKEVFWQKISQDPVYLKSLLNILTSRIRQVDQRAFVYAHSDLKKRLSFFLDKVIQDATPSTKNPNQHTAKLTVSDFAYMVGTTQQKANAFLIEKQNQGQLKLTSKDITFYGNQNK